MWPIRRVPLAWLFVGIIVSTGPLPEAAWAQRLPPLEAAPPRGSLIYLDEETSIAVESYQEEGDQIVFHKYGGVIRINKGEILRIVPRGDGGSGSSPPARQAPPPRVIYEVALRSGGVLRGTRLTAEGEQLQLAGMNGSFSIPAQEVVAIVRFPETAGHPDAPGPEAWITIWAVATPQPPEPPVHPSLPLGPRQPVLPLAPPDGVPKGDAWPSPSIPDNRATEIAAIPPPAPLSAVKPKYRTSQSDQPHTLVLVDGTTIEIPKGYWIDREQVKFQRFGGTVGIPLDEVMEVRPRGWRPATPLLEETPRLTVKLWRVIDLNVLEVTTEGKWRRVRLIGVEPRPGGGLPGLLAGLSRGSPLQLEFDRQHQDPDGTLLAYVYLPSGRMLNAELVRLGLARPAVDPGALKYLDLFHELADRATQGSPQ